MSENNLSLRELRNPIWGPICAFGDGFEFLANRLWPIGYVDLRETKTDTKIIKLASQSSFAIPSFFFNGDDDLMQQGMN